MEGRISFLHSFLACLATPLMPASQALIPGTPRARCRAMVLLIWTLVGFVIPTVGLVPQPVRWFAPRHERGGTTGRGPGDGWDVHMQRCLQLLKWPPDPEHPGAIEERLLCTLRWWVLTSVVWAVCCWVAEP